MSLDDCGTVCRALELLGMARHTPQKKLFLAIALGPAGPTVTLNVYAHLMKPTNQEAACRLENAIFGATGHKMVTKTKKGQRPKTVTP
jgi:hypothetical protein